MRKLCIIPARGGSKRIPRKNVKAFFGKPIITYTIETAINSQLFDEVMVSTDDDEIKEIALQNGAEVPFKRSDEKANDTAVLADVIAEVLEQYKKVGKEFDIICCLLPTAVLTKVDYLNLALVKLKEPGITAVIPIIKYGSPIQRALKVNENYIEMNSQYVNERSQDLQPHYFDAGQFYLLETNYFLKEKKIFMKEAGYIELAEYDAQDVDTAEDWRMLEIKYRYQL